MTQPQNTDSQFQTLKYMPSQPFDDDLVSPSPDTPTPPSLVPQCPPSSYPLFPPTERLSTCSCAACTARTQDLNLYLTLYTTLLDALPRGTKLAALTSLPLPANTLELAQVLGDFLGEVRWKERIELEDLKDEIAGLRGLEVGELGGKGTGGEEQVVESGGHQGAGKCRRGPVPDVEPVDVEALRDVIARQQREIARYKQLGEIQDLAMALHECSI
ncbi:hypothetical protein SVAN01_04937 [Stagonosporopsis vannaccii]|nr:hypothetical protein SVAN01_04937 [Stagonosporopsis vannaccii]